MSLLRWLRNKRRLLISASSMLLILLVSMFALRIYAAGRARDRIYTLDTVPAQPVAIIFGALVTPSGRPSAMLADRVKMGAQLYTAGKVQALLLTGDNHIDSYNEPEAMRQYALSLGVPDSALVLDYAGFRTYDSCYRARDVFKVDKAVLVTQAFHLDRALLTCNGLGVESVGVPADVVRPTGYGTRSLLTSQVREYPSTAFAFIDLISGRKPTFLGDPLPIFANR